MILGVDLAGSEKRNTGIALLDGKNFLDIGIVHSDNELLTIIKKTKLEIVAIDAPLTLPKGRKNINQKNKAHFRECDLKLRKLGIRFFPITLGPMRMLTKRGIKLRNKMKKQKIRVVEVFPGASYDIWKVNRKDKREILEMFRKSGFKFKKRNYTQDEIDAMCCAITGLFINKQKALALKGKDGCIWLPLSSSRKLSRQHKPLCLKASP
ncbi:MAG: DUF429 domain-containing protein [Candidatus Bilamarchaeaceae archaeon]